MRVRARVCVCLCVRACMCVFVCVCVGLHSAWNVNQHYGYAIGTIVKPKSCR